MVDVFPHRLVTKVEFAFGADPAGDPGTWTWTDVTDRRQAQSIVITRGRQNEGAQSQTGSITITLDNPDGDLTPDNPNSVHYPNVVEGTPMRYSLQWDGVWYGRFFGEVASWEPDWPYGDLSNEDTGYVGEARVIVTANGITRRLGQGTKALKDALRRHIQTAGPVRYWPLTDGERAREGSEVAAGAQPLRAIGTAGSFYQGQPGWGKGTLGTWLDPVVQLAAQTSGKLTVGLQSHSLTSWAVDHTRSGIGEGDGPGTGGGEVLVLFDSGQMTDADPRITWEVETHQPTDRLYVYVVSVGETTSSVTELAEIVSPGIFDLATHHIRFQIADDGGGGTDWTLFADGETVDSGNHAVPTRPLSRIQYVWGNYSVLADSISLGHLVYWGETVPDVTDTWRAVEGYDRELSGRRIERLCAEQGVPLLVNGNLDQTPRTGPQKPGAFLDLLQSAADVDGGVLYEARDTPGLEYRTLKSKYNQGV